MSDRDKNESSTSERLAEAEQLRREMQEQIIAEQEIISEQPAG